ncbi:transcriptional regulator [Clostridium pasteurianum DSM 525 = ATCC 6013]|uniref:Transcriptional regulator n=1 Tax=Clostridium pasteurianum DSM 525 = ATCC 6013 TaxID=1262449 RepID=A0A0H3IZU2_CLOPA|nr:MerR family transcriptional regulator [Clostridium pasteurianum]AJA47071.1 transcriptional regulator [Clostridium pasteurianum DSM 525 = ATCC 6013]AJA51059.1 transcriptional regulator [Clostridium pasteurianum DSM 525 = ATCC 6013]AOZ74434.1 MerR family transcriptional regulator [Clostridium pasteurianum DSM 525 = ATCC 6013]AOZ78231.1 MerR family transcriptional regulator [Clostridium pasteurianum]ELP59542.1 transcriptional regulator [Clostridium pasteurianum DSM 525 = ATCC 6013]
MYSIGKLCKEYNLSRSTLLYYDSIGILKASERTKSNYRIYSEEDKERLGQICLYREAGVSLEEIKELLNSKKKSEENILKKRLIQLNNELHILRLQQKIIVKILKSKSFNSKVLMMNKKNLVSILKSSGIKEESLHNLHVEFERMSPHEHQIFLEFLGIDEEEIKCIRSKAKTEINKLL